MGVELKAGRPGVGSGTSPATNQARDRQLSAYYRVALNHIDPALPSGSSLKKIFEAVQKHRVTLLNRPVCEVRKEMAKLDELTLFIQRIHREYDGPPPYVDELEESSPQQPAGLPDEKPVPLRAKRPGHPSSSAGISRDNIPKSLLGSIDGSTVLAPDLFAETSAIPLTGPIQRQDALARDPLPIPRAKAGMSPLRRAMEQGRFTDGPPEQTRQTTSPRNNQTGSRRTVRPQKPLLPEALVWPVACGLLLLGWQVGIAFLMGLAVTRLIVWPCPVTGYGVSSAGGLGLVLLGTATALTTLWFLRGYRLNTRRLSWLAHLTGIAGILYLMAWWRAAGRMGGIIEPPTVVLQLSALLVWLAMVAFTYYHDRFQANHTE